VLTWLLANHAGAPQEGESAHIVPTLATTCMPSSNPPHLDAAGVRQQFETRAYWGRFGPTRARKNKFQAHKG
jgi:hypothetical protein